jgi:hypothetical protein
MTHAAADDSFGFCDFLEFHDAAQAIAQATADVETNFAQ